MLSVQEKEFKIKEYLNDIELDINKEIDIYYEEITGERKLIKMANINGRIAIFIDGVSDVELKEWQGNRDYVQKIREIEDKFDNE